MTRQRNEVVNHCYLMKEILKRSTFLLNHRVQIIVNANIFFSPQIEIYFDETRAGAWSGKKKFIF